MKRWRRTRGCSAGGYVVRLVSRGVTDRSAHLPAPRGLGSWRTTSSPKHGRALALRTVSRRPLRPSGAFHGGSSPVDSAAFGFTAPLLDLRWVEHRDPRGPYDRGAPHAKACARNPPDLDADFPVASRSMRSDLPVELPLLGLSKDRPSIVPNRRVRRPGSVSPPLPSGWDSQSLPRAVRVVSHHLDGFSSPTAQVCFALLPIMGFAVFLPVAKRASSQRIPALRSFPPADSDGSGTSPCPWARVTSHHCWLPFTARLAPSPFSSDTVSAVSHLTSAPIARAVAWRRGLEALLHRRVRCRRARCQT
jgi:hypothetical protein